jgi:hypothetical protein
MDSVTRNDTPPFHLRQSEFEMNDPPRLMERVGVSHLTCRISTCHRLNQSKQCRFSCLTKLSDISSRPRQLRPSPMSRISSGNHPRCTNINKRVPKFSRHTYQAHSRTTMLRTGCRTALLSVSPLSLLHLSPSLTNPTVRSKAPHLSFTLQLSLTLRIWRYLSAGPTRLSRSTAQCFSLALKDVLRGSYLSGLSKRAWQVPIAPVTRG